MRFYGALPATSHRDFASVIDPVAYEALPSDWLIGLTDVVDSKSALSAGHYKDVNYAGASVIAALANVWGSFDFPFVFRGDGAAFALPPEAAGAAKLALRQVASFARDRFDLALRIGLLTVGQIRVNGNDVKVARYAASEQLSYALFTGGGLKWADKQIKDGRFLVKQSQTAIRPNLSGLACEWKEFPSQRGKIISLLVEPRDHKKYETFAVLNKLICEILEESPPEHPTLSLGDPDSAPYRWAEVAANSDARKYDDGLRLTQDCSPSQIKRLTEVLSNSRARGEINFGMHQQSRAILTCFVPTGTSRTDFHFLDGVCGGYSQAAEAMAAGVVQL